MTEFLGKRILEPILNDHLFDFEQPERLVHYKIDEMSEFEPLPHLTPLLLTEENFEDDSFSRRQRFLVHFSKLLRTQFARAL